MRSNRILLVEDHPDVRPMLEQMLLGEGYRVDVAATAMQAAPLLEASCYDLVLTDGVLPDGDGVAIADQAKAQDTPALILTGYAPRFAKEHFARHEFVTKPVRTADLLAAVARKLAAAR